MKITAVKLYQVPPRSLFLKLETDEGICGWGEPLVEGRASTVEACVKECEYLLLGSDPLKIEYLWQVLYRCAFYRGGPVMMSTIAGIDQALWDIKGKYYNAPVYELLGGAVKNRIKVYRGAGTNKQDVKLGIEQGYKLLKFGVPGGDVHYVDTNKKIDTIVKTVFEAIEDAGNEVDFGIDFHGRIHKPMAATLVKELEPAKLAFVEEPVLPQNNEVLKQIAAVSATKIATGERMFSRWDYKPLFEMGGVDIIQPDVSHAGGISEVKRISAMAGAYDLGVAPHSPLGVIAFAACLQIDACTPNAVFQEQSLGIHDTTKNNPNLRWLKDCDNTFTYKDGYLDLPTKPGLGVEIDEEAVIEASKTPHDWKNPLYQTFDGTPIEW